MKNPKNCCLKLPSVAGNLRQVHFLCKINTTWNLVTLIGITKSFEGVNCTHMPTTWTNFLIILSKISKELFFQHFLAIAYRGVGSLPPTQPHQNFKDDFILPIYVLFNKSKYDFESACWALPESIKFKSVALTLLEKRLRIWLSKVSRKSTKYGGEL